MDSSDSYCLSPLLVAIQFLQGIVLVQNWCNIRPVFLLSTSRSLSLSVLASTDTVSAVSLLLPGQFLTLGLPWLVQLRALFLAAPEGRAFPTATQPHSSCRREQSRPGRDFWAQTPCSGACPPPGSREGVPRVVASPPPRRTRGVPLSHHVPWAPAGLARLSHRRWPGAIPRLPLRCRLLSPGNLMSSHLGEGSCMALSIHNSCWHKPAMARGFAGEGQGSWAPPGRPGPPPVPAGGVVGAWPRLPV